MNHGAIEKLSKDIKRLHPDLFLYEGFGNCAYASKLLKDKLAASGIKSQLLIGEYLGNSVLAEKCRINATAIVKGLPNDDSVYGEIKRAFVKRGNKLLEHTGHAVVIIDDVIYDITSGQFGLPFQYAYYEFAEMWVNKYLAEIVLNGKKEDFGVEKITRRPFVYYQERPDSTVTSNGKLYSLNVLFKGVVKQKIIQMKVSDLKWILQYTQTQADRVNNADLSKPILVYHDLEKGYWVTLDGAHRLTKAVRDKQTSLPAYAVDQSLLDSALLKSASEEQRVTRPLYNQW